MPIDVPDNYPCSICENFAGRHPWHGAPAVVYEDEQLYIIMAPAPLGGMEGHVLVFPRRHVETVLDLRAEEAARLGQAVSRIARAVSAAFDPDAILVQQHNGTGAFQTVPHMHFHVIPKAADAPFPPIEEVPITPSDDRALLAKRVREEWVHADWAQVSTADAETGFYDDAAIAPRPNHPRRVSVIALIEDEKGRLLLDRRADSPVWAVIGGALENDETFIEGLRREVREETGLVITEYEFFGTFSDPGRVVAYPDGNIFQIASLVYRVKVDDVAGLRPSSESTDLRFFARAELPPDDLAATHRPILRRYLGRESPPFFE